MVYVKKSSSRVPKRLRSKTVSKATQVKVSKPKLFKPKIEPVERFRKKTEKRGSVTL